MWKVIVAGGRDFLAYPQMEQELGELAKHWSAQYESWQVVSGRARGADQMGEYWASRNKVPVKFFPAQWDKHGKSAGFIRNQEMAKYADCLVAFWDGESKGTLHMIDTALREGLEVHVYRY